MALTEDQKNIYATLLEAAKNDDLVLLECQDRETGVDIAVVCILQGLDPDTNEGDDVELIPLASISVNPFEQFTPPEVVKTR